MLVTGRRVDSFRRCGRTRELFVELIAANMKKAPDLEDVGEEVLDVTTPAKNLFSFLFSLPPYDREPPSSSSLRHRQQHRLKRPWHPKFPRKSLGRVKQEVGSGEETPKMPPGPSGERGKRVTILSIDGGGVRGIIPATILHELEACLQVNYNEFTIQVSFCVTLLAWSINHLAALIFKLGWSSHVSLGCWIRGCAVGPSLLQRCEFLLSSLGLSAMQFFEENFLKHFGH